MSAETVTIASRPECVEEARDWVTARARAAGFGDAAIGEVELALTEALANVIEHGYGGDGSHEIVVGARTEDGRLRVTVRDWGQDLDLSGYSPRDLDEPGEGGYGVYLMEQLMDEVTYEPQPGGGTLLTLVKNNEEGRGRNG